MVRDRTRTDERRCGKKPYREYGGREAQQTGRDGDGEGPKRGFGEGDARRRGVREGDPRWRGVRDGDGRRRWVGDGDAKRRGVRDGDGDAAWRMVDTATMPPEWVRVEARGLGGGDEVECFWNWGGGWGSWGAFGLGRTRTPA